MRISSAAAGVSATIRAMPVWNEPSLPVCQASSSRSSMLASSSLNASSLASTSGAGLGQPPGGSGAIG
jgi:hypothetical protein